MTPDARVGTVLAGCRISSEIGRGGMGVVYLAEHLHLGRKVALKLLPPEYAENTRFRERFVRESRLAATIDHPNVIPVYDAGEADGLLYISMRYVEGEDLKSLIAREAPLAPERAVAILERIAAALDAAHAAGLVHRDVKPGNVLIGTNGHVFLTDFGLTRRTDSQTALTGTGLVVGTVAYMAPEQFRAGEIDARTDIYSLGCLLFACLTGHVPFERDTEAATMFAHLNDPPPAASEHGARVPRELDAVVAQAMAKTKEGRFATCAEFARAARAALSAQRSPSGEDTKPEPPTPALGTPGTPRGRRRMRIALIAVGGLLLALIGVSLLLVQFRPDGDSADDVAAGRLVFASKRDGNWEVYVADADGSNPRNLTNDPDQDEPAAPSPDGRKIAFRTNREGTFEIYVMNADGSSPRRLTDGEGQNFWPTWSPDGSKIAFTRDRDDTTGIFVMDADGSNVQPVVTSPPGFPEYRVAARPWHSRAAFSPRGDVITFEAIGELGVDIFSLAENGTASKLTTDPGTDRSATWSPRGDLIVFTSNRDGNEEIYTMRPDGSRQTRLTNNSASDSFPAFTSDGRHIVFESGRSGDQDIWIMGADGSDPRRLIGTPLADHIPGWLRAPAT